MESNAMARRILFKSFWVLIILFNALFVLTGTWSVYESFLEQKTNDAICKGNEVIVLLEKYRYEKGMYPIEIKDVEVYFNIKIKNPYFFGFIEKDWIYRSNGKEFEIGFKAFMTDGLASYAQKEGNDWVQGIYY